MTALYLQNHTSVLLTLTFSEFSMRITVLKLLSQCPVVVFKQMYKTSMPQNLNQKLFPPGLEPGTFRVLGERDNHYTTET